MGTRHDGSGQILPLAALLLVVIMGMAAFAVDGSNLYAQHRRWQADLDVAVKVAAAGLNSSTGYTATLTQAMFGLTQTLAQDGYPLGSAAATTPMSGTNDNYGACLSTSGVTLCNPPVSTPFQGLSQYVQGTISYTVPGFFGGAIGLGKMHLNVQAVAKHSSSFALKSYAIVGLNIAQEPNGCPIAADGSNGSSWTVVGNIRSNDENCLNGGGATPPITVTGTSEMCWSSSACQAVTGKTPITGTLGTYENLGLMSDPYTAITFAKTPPTTQCYTGSSGVTAGVIGADGTTVCASVPTTCTNEVNYYLGSSTGTAALASTNIFYFDGVAGTAQPPGTAVQVQWNSSGGGSYYLLPGCDGSPTGTVPPTGTSPSVFYFTGAIGNSGISSLESFSSTVVLDPLFTLNLPPPGQTQAATNTVFALDAPGSGSGPYTGLALTQLRPTDPNSGQLICLNKQGKQASGANQLVTNIALQGNTDVNRPSHGIIDIPCATLTFVGNASGATPTIRGAVVANNVKVGASSSAWVEYDSQLPSLSGGAVLVY